VTNNSKYYSQVEVDENGDLVLPLPDELLEELGWTTDTVIDFESHDDYFTLRKVNEHEEQNH
jgi:bifunctional DNA-binding transcriptional regulator/antitoxin component of YhaV-PrlF toxin-antitoxin module